jgi:hypothetical protein
MNAGVEISPRGSFNKPERASERSSVFSMEKEVESVILVKKYIVLSKFFLHSFVQLLVFDS